MILTGKTPPGVATTVRKDLYLKNADFEEVAKMSHMTTSEGRHHLRNQFKRYIQLLQKENTEKLGYTPKASKIERNVL